MSSTARELLHALDQLKNDNRQREYYLTDCPGILRSEGKLVEALPVLQPCEALSINTADELAGGGRDAGVGLSWLVRCPCQWSVVRGCRCTN